MSFPAITAHVNNQKYWVIKYNCAPSHLYVLSHMPPPCCWGQLGATENDRTKVSFFGGALYSLQRILAVRSFIWRRAWNNLLFFNGWRTAGWVGNVPKVTPVITDKAEFSGPPPNPESLLTRGKETIWQTHLITWGWELRKLPQLTL